jgi:hypothetical protein
MHADPNLMMILESLRDELPPHVSTLIEDVIRKVLSKRIRISKLYFQRFLAVLLQDNQDALRRAMAKGKQKIALRGGRQIQMPAARSVSPQPAPPAHDPKQPHSPTRLATEVEHMAL